VLKGLVLSGTLMAMWLVVQAVVFHVAAPRKAFSSMLIWFSPTVPLYFVLYWLLPADLGILVTRGRFMNQDFELLNRAKDWISGVKAQFASLPPEEKEAPPSIRPEPFGFKMF